MSGLFARYVDALTSQFFKKDEQGRELYFPFGIWSRGRLLPDAAAAADVRGKVRRVYGATMVAVIVAMGLAQSFSGAGIIAAIAFGAVACIGLSAYLFRIARPYPITEARLMFEEAGRAQARIYGPGVYLVFAVFFAALAAFGVFMAVSEPRETFPMAELITLGFGAGALLFLRLRRMART